MLTEEIKTKLTNFIQEFHKFIIKRKNAAEKIGNKGETGHIRLLTRDLLQDLETQISNLDLQTEANLIYHAINCLNSLKIILANDKTGLALIPQQLSTVIKIHQKLLTETKSIKNQGKNIAYNYLTNNYQLQVDNKTSAILNMFENNMANYNTKISSNGYLDPDKLNEINSAIQSYKKLKIFN